MSVFTTLSNHPQVRCNCQERPSPCDAHSLKRPRGASARVVAGVLVLSAAVAVPGRAQEPSPLGWDPHLTFAGNFDFGYRNTQFFQPNHNVIVGQWDSRAELWLPPYRWTLAWGPYVRATGIAASKAEAWENAWLSEPGVGFQIYPFSLPKLRNASNRVPKILGPLRLFAEYNRMDYWGKENSWRPTGQTRYGAEYWRSLHVNDLTSRWWAENWNGLWWQSANEFDPRYRSTIFANAVRSGVRAPKRGALSALTPYVALESSLTANTSYFWENRLLVGGGFRITPPLYGPFQQRTRVNRLALYAEYLHVGTYYRDVASQQANLAGIPNHEVRVGLTFSTGLWYY